MENFDKLMQELLRRGKHSEAVKLLGKKEEWFWTNEYPKLSEQQKVKYWSSYIRTQMRSFGEQGDNEMDVFSKKELDVWKHNEPRIKELLPEVLRILNLNEDNVNKRFK